MHFQRTERERIYYVGGFELPDKNAAAHRVLSNAKIFRCLGYEVVLVGTSREIQSSAEVSRRAEDVEGFECWEVPYPSGMRRWLRHLGGRRDVAGLIGRDDGFNCAGVIFYNYPSVAMLRMQALCRRLRVPAISDTTEWYDAGGGSILFRLLKACDTALRMHVGNRRADALMTTSRFLTDYYAEAGLPIVELPTLYDAERFSYLRNERSSGGLRTFIYVGNPFNPGRVSRKRDNLKERLDTAIDVFLKIHRGGRNFRFDIFGINRSDYSNIFPEHDSALDEMRAKVFFHGKKPHKEVIDAVSVADFSVFFRDDTRVTRAGFPSKLAESITCGTPVVCNEMMSLDRYRSVVGVRLVRAGGEVEALQRIIDMTDSEVSNLKHEVRRSCAFDFHKFQMNVERFMVQVKAEKIKNADDIDKANS